MVYDRTLWRNLIHVASPPLSGIRLGCCCCYCCCYCWGFIWL